MLESIAITPSNEFALAFHAAFDATARERAALPPEALLPVNIDVQAAVTTVIGSLSRMKGLRAEVVGALPLFDVAEFDKMEAYARALAYAQTAYLAASTPNESLPELAERALALRDLLLSDANALAHRGLLDGKRLAGLKGGAGYLNVASDLGVLVRMLRERWAEISTKSAIQPTELDESEQIFEQITLAVAARQVQPETVAVAADDRQRAFTLLVKTYGQARRAATYLRWGGDVEGVTPSLWAGRGGRRNEKQEPAEQPAANGTPAVAEPVAPLPVAPAGPSGMPGGSPFANG